ncbi:stage V sporulation protein D [Phosphitispora fastidiosa]|uniref:stage V sporulation protein D n=1 Tax=Phosphitispora fastidiosa TaxID=2837202 RepID=UPI001E5F69FB|nr:stage V sporulation protein D (sporulation-specific penicillin-binding protein) [Phosphitispora fastidiosa]
MQATSIIIRKRVTRLFIVVGVVLCLLVGRLAWIQFVRGEELKEKAKLNRMDDIPIPAERGAIYDRNGEELVVSISSDSVCAFPPLVKDGDPEKTAREVARVLGMEYETVYKRITNNTNFEYIKRRVDPEITQELKELDLPGIDIIEESKRSYSKGKLASHILGFVGYENKGLDGLEVKMDEYLSGTPGRIVIEKDARGRQIPQALHERIPPDPGNNVWLTLDETIQYFVERELDNIVTQYEPKSAVIIVMDPETGAILGMGSRPDFDPADYGKYPEQNRRNMAIQLNYEPGSTFKIITSAAALEEGTVKPDDRFYDPGYATVGDRRIKCWKYPQAHGAQSFEEVVMNSCNTGFVEVGLKLGGERFYRYINAFGFGQKTGINLSGEGKGIMIPEKDIIPVNIATIAMGQSISVTPLQLITAMSAVANDGVLMKPRIIEKITDSKGKLVKEYTPEPVRQVVSKDTSRQLSLILEKVVNSGTGKNAYLEGYRVAGKTGTAQKAGPGGYIQGKYVASFAGFAPADDPKIALLVVIDEPKPGMHYGGQLAAPVFKNISKDTLRYLNVTPELSEEEIENREEQAQVLVPDVVNTALEDAQIILREAGLKARIEGEGSWINNQQPKAGAKIPAGSEVIIYLGQRGGNIPEGQERTVPDLTGMTMREAGQLLGSLGLQLNPEGTGIVVEQKLPPGTKLKSGEEVTVVFSPPVWEPSP